MNTTELGEGVRPTVAVQRLDPGVPVPGYAVEGDAGADLCTTEDFELAPGERRLVPTGIAIALPSGYVGLVHPRSGLAVRHGITIVNAPGTIDSGYRGELKVTLLNTDRERAVAFSRGDRIAQLLVQRVEHAVFTEVDGLDETSRGARGFGSTGGFETAGAGRDAAVAAGTQTKDTAGKDR